MIRSDFEDLGAPLTLAPGKSRTAGKSSIAGEMRSEMKWLWLILSVVAFGFSVYSYWVAVRIDYAAFYMATSALWYGFYLDSKKEDR